MAGRSPADNATGAIGFVAAVMVVCCGAHLLVIGVLGGLAVGTVLGAAAGVLAFVALVAALVIVRRRRRAACAVPSAAAADTPGASGSSASAASPIATPAAPSSAPRGLGERRPKETSDVR